MGRGLGAVLVRVVAVIAMVLLVGLVLRLMVAIVTPVLPAGFMRDLQAGWDMLYGMVSPAMAAIMAVVILGALCWVVLGRR